MHVSYIVNASALTPTMYIWPWLLNREAERQKDLQKKFPEVSNSEPSKTKTQQVSEKACDMCFSLFCLLYYQFAKCPVAFLQHGRMDHLLWRHARSRSWINLANKALEAARRTQASSSCLRCWNHVPFLGIQTTFCQEATYPRYMLILFNAGMEKGQLHAIYGIPTRHGASCEGYIENLPREGECTNPEAEGTWKFVRSHKISFLKSQIVIRMLKSSNIRELRIVLRTGHHGSFFFECTNPREQNGRT